MPCLRTILALPFLLATPFLPAVEPINVASKKFTEGALLGQIATDALQASGIPAIHQSRLGGTTVCFKALESGAIDVYADYTGTLIRELLSALQIDSFAGLEAALADRGIGITRPLGFDNTYAIAVRSPQAAELGLTNISDLASQPQLRLGFGPEFIARRDCWPGLRERYALPQQEPTSLLHELAYRALSTGEIDVIEVYTTDAKIPLYDVTLLVDDRNFFPRYQAVYLYRLLLLSQRPAAVEVLKSFENRISTEQMRALNSRIDVGREPEREVAADFLRQQMKLHVTVRSNTLFQRILRRSREHLLLVLISLGLGVLAGVPLGLYCVRRPAAGRVVLALVGVIQTIPSLALLVLMIPILGINAPPAIAALFLYSLLPIVRGTHSGLSNLPADLLESSRALGLPAGTRLWRIELPLAAPAILSGIKVAAVINVGFATLGAFVGAGGYGAPILTGIDLNNMPMILEGALPAAMLALIVQFLLGALEYRIVPRGLQSGSSKS